MTLEIGRVFEQDVTVVLYVGVFDTTYDTRELFRLPERVVVPAGSRRVVVEVEAPDDDLFYFGRAVVQLAADHSGTVSGSGSLRFNYLENDVAQLTLQLSSDVIRAGNVSGGRFIGIISTNALALRRDLDVITSASDASVVTTPARVFSYAREGSFVLVGRDTGLTTARRVRITASAPGFASARAEITVLPLSTPLLRLRVDPTVPGEGETTQVTVVRTGDLSRALMARIERGPIFASQSVRTVTFAPNQASVRFPLVFPRDNRRDPNVVVLLTARASDYVSSFLTVRIANPEPAVRLRTDVSRLTENGEGQGALILNLEQPFDRALTVRVRRLGSRIRFADGAVNATRNVVFAPGTTQISVSFAVTNDEILNRDRDGLAPLEGFAVTQPFAPREETSLVVNVLDDEAPFQIVLADNQIGVNEFGAYLDGSGQIVLNAPTSQPQEITVRIFGGNVSEIFSVTVPAGARSAPFRFRSESGSPTTLRFLAISQNDQNFTAAANLTLPPLETDFYNNLNASVAENGPVGTVVLRRRDASRTQTYTLNAFNNFNRVFFPRQVTFRAGQIAATVAVRPIDNHVRDGNAVISIVSEETEADRTYVVRGSVTVLDDDTDLPATDETPSPVRVLTSGVRYDARTQSVRVRVTFAADLSFDTPSFFGESLLLSINGRQQPDLYNGALRESRFLPYRTVELTLSDPQLRPGARFELTFLSLRDAQNRLLPAEPISLVVPSQTST